VQRGRFVVNQKSYSRLKIENLQSNVTEQYPNTLMLMFEVAVAGRLHPVLRVSGSCFQGCELLDWTRSVSSLQDTHVIEVVMSEHVGICSASCYA
jgi:hypothetical protein